jgi:hypothetical protein
MHRDLGTARGVPRRALEHLRQFRRDVYNALPGRVTQIVLFGSRARGDHQRDSDYDVAVFVRDLDDTWAINRIVSRAAFPHMSAGVHIRPLAVPSDFLTTGDLLALDIQRDGIPVQ